MDDLITSDQSSRDSAVLRWIGDFAPYGVITTDREFRVQSWNRWMTTHSGKDSNEVIGRKLFDIFPDLVERNLFPRFERALAGEISVLSTALHGYLLKLDSTIQDDFFKEMQQTARVAPLELALDFWRNSTRRVQLQGFLVRFDQKEHIGFPIQMFRDLQE